MLESESRYIIIASVSHDSAEWRPNCNVEFNKLLVMGALAVTAHQLSFHGNRRMSCEMDQVKKQVCDGREYTWCHLGEGTNTDSASVRIESRERR